jgi:hypothetical protein
MHFVYKNATTPDDELKVERVVQTPLLAEPMFRLAFTTTANSGNRVSVSVLPEPPRTGDVYPLNAQEPPRGLRPLRHCSGEQQRVSQFHV